MAKSGPRAGELESSLNEEPLNYISWALPRTLIPLLKENRQYSLIPSLDFSPHRPNKKDSAKAHNDSYRDNSYGNGEHIFQHDIFSQQDSQDSSASEPSIPSFKQLWTSYVAAMSRLREQTDQTHGAEKFLEWLDENAQRNRLAQRVYENLQRDIETRLREHLEWAHRKLKNPLYRVPVQKLLPWSKEHQVSEVSAVPRAATGIIDQEDRQVNRDFTYEKIAVIPNTKEINFPAIYAVLHPDKTKHILWDLVNGITTKRFKRKSKSLKRAVSKAFHLHLEEQEKTSSSAGKQQKRRSKKPKAAGKRKGRTKYLVGVDRDEDDDLADTDSEESEVSAASSVQLASKMRKQEKNSGKTNYQTLRPEVSLDTGATSMQSSSSNVSGEVDLKRPVPVKKGHDEYYTPEELAELRKYAKKKYTLEYYDEPADISAKDALVEKGPSLPGPTLMQNIASLVANKRWRLSDFFTFTDKDKTWKLDKSKLKETCKKVGMDSVTETTITDMIVELDDATRDALTFKDLRKGMRAWIKERRVRLRYCIKIEEMLMEEADKAGMPMDSFASVTSESGGKTKTEILKDVEEKTLDGLSPIRKHLTKNNVQPIMPPEDIGTEVCDEPGKPCKWHAVFSEKLILAWRIQKKLEELYGNSRWKDVKHALKLFGHLRAADHETLEDVGLEPEPAPEIVMSSHEKLQQLARAAPVARTITSHDDVLRRFSLRGERKNFADRFGRPGRKVHRFSENDADINAEHSQYFFNPKDPLTEELDKGMLATAPSRIQLPTTADTDSTRLENQMKQLTNIKGELDLLNPDKKTVRVADDESLVIPEKPHIVKSQAVEAAQKLVSSKEVVQIKKVAQENFEKMAEKEKKHTASEEHLAKGLSRKISGTNTGNREERSSYEKFLRKRFREIHNVWLVEAEPTDVLETLQLRAVKMLEKAVEQEEDRQRAALDPTRKNETTRELIAEIADIVTDTKENLREVPALPGTAPPLDAQQVRHNEIKTTLLQDARGLFGKDYICFMDPRSRSILTLARKLKSELSTSENDPRRFRRRVASKACTEPLGSYSADSHRSISTFHSVALSVSSWTESRSAKWALKVHPVVPENPSRVGSQLVVPQPAGAQREPAQQKASAPVWIDSRHLTVGATPSAASSATKAGTPEITETQAMFSEMWHAVTPKTPEPAPVKHHVDHPELHYHDSDESAFRRLTAEHLERSNIPRKKIQRMMAQVTLILEAFLTEKREHLMRGLTKQIKKQAKATNISKYQSIEVVERRLVQQDRMKKLDESYQGSMRRAMWTDFRQMMKKTKRRNVGHLLPEHKLRAALLRHEDLDHKVESHNDAVKHLDSLLEKAYGGPAPERRHRKWFKRFLSLPAFFPLNDDLDLMKTMRAVETAEIA